jgi:membrane fusion protein (multidrug efflux system)
VRIGAGTRQVITVPQSAVVQGSQSRYVWTVDAQGKAMQRSVETGAWTGSDWIISSGLAAGDTIIVDNLMKLNPGTPVEIAPAVASGDSPINTASAAR